MERALAKGDMRSYGQADTEFHLEIVETAGNHHLNEACRMILGRVAPAAHASCNQGRGRAAPLVPRPPLGIPDADGPRHEKQVLLLESHIHRTRKNCLDAFREAHLSPSNRMQSRLKLGWTR